jgi:hypothetical protein
VDEDLQPPFRLVPDKISHDTVEALQELLALARTGDLIGVAYAGMLKRRGYIVDSAGEAYRNPTFSRGMVCALDDHFGSRVGGRTRKR